jgi:pimeloyl-ACP methyl ester carboxylesterase
VALVRGANSELLSAATAAEMRRRRPDMIFAEVPGRGHIPFLDEPESLAAIRAFLEQTA